MYVTYLECPHCGLKHDHREMVQLCPKCSAPLLVKYDLTRITAVVNKRVIEGRPRNLWRYRELLPIKDLERAVSLGEVMTPLLQLKCLGAQLGLAGLYLKDESLNSSGTFAARGAAIGVSRAKELGVKKLAISTNGNAGAAWAVYCAKASIKAYVVMPVDAPAIPRNECAITGAKLYLVEGLINDCAKIAEKAVIQYGWLNASALTYRIEGKKTIGFEMAEQFNWEGPDVIVYPTGSGAGIIGIYKALVELRDLGWIGGKLPRLVAVQASGCAPIVKAWKENKHKSGFWNNPKTTALGINVPNPQGDLLILEALYKTNGRAIAVSDEQISVWQAEIARKEGLFICPEGAATLAAAKELIDSGWIKPEERAVLLNTGSGLKYPWNGKVIAPILKPDEELIAECH